jgi:outer membrane protein assembly factor BamB
MRDRTKNIHMLPSLKTSRPIGVLKIAFGLCLITTFIRADDWPQWRGPQRNGLSQETGLLKEWPKEGPPLLWKLDDIDSGYSTPSVVGDRLYLLSNDGLKNEFVAAFAVNDGRKTWTTRLGNVGNPKQQPSFPAARSTPTIDGDFLYALGSDGDLACLDVRAGKIIWARNLRSDFGGKPGAWAYAESPLADGDAVVCTPGGSEATLLALNKKSGEVLWKCPLPEADAAGFSSTIIVESGGVKQYVQLLEKGLVGVDAKTGQFLWRYTKPVSKYGANIPTPVSSGNYIYAGSAGTGGGLVKLTAKDGKLQAEQVYFESKLPTAIGGAVKVGNFLYGTTSQLLCIDFATAEVKWEDRAIGAASLCSADGQLYLHGENGEVALAEASPESYHDKGRFTPANLPNRSNGMEKAWAYPVVANGHLYIRDLNHLWCYNIKKAAGTKSAHNPQ